MQNGECKVWVNFGDKLLGQRQRQKQKKTKTKTNDECPGGADFRNQLLGQLDDEDKEDEEYDEDDVEWCRMLKA